MKPEKMDIVLYSTRCHHKGTDPQSPIDGFGLSKSFKPIYVNSTKKINVSRSLRNYTFAYNT